MSVKAFLLKIWEEVNKLFEQMPIDLQTAAHIAVVIVENLKIITDNPAVDLLTALIPGDIDNKILAWLRSRLPTILVDLRLVDTVTEPENANVIVASGLKVIQSLDGDIKNAFLHDLGILIATEIAKVQGNQLTWKDAVYIVEWYYQHKYKVMPK